MKNFLRILVSVIIIIALFIVAKLVFAALTIDAHGITSYGNTSWPNKNWVVIHTNKAVTLVSVAVDYQSDPSTIAYIYEWTGLDELLATGSIVWKVAAFDLQLANDTTYSIALDADWATHTTLSYPATFPYNRTNVNFTAWFSVDHPVTNNLYWVVSVTTSWTITQNTNNMFHFF